MNFKSYTYTHVLVAASLLFSFQLLFTSCSSSSGKELAKEELFHIISPLVKDTSHFQDYVADIQSFQHVEVRTRVKGYIEKIHVDEGRFVNKGQLIFSISNQEYKEELSKAKALLKNAIAEAKSAELDFYNAKLLAEKGVVSQTEVEMAKSKYDAMNAKIDEAKSQEVSAALRLSFTEIRAPFSGVLDRMPHKPGSLVDEGSLLTTISDNSEVYVYFNVSEKEYLEFATAKKDPTTKAEVSLLLANNKEHSHKGYVETVEGEVDKVTGSIAFRARFLNPNNLLKHGSSGKIRMVKKLEKALMIPQKSTFEIQDQVYVYVVGADNIVKMKSFVPKLRIPHLYVVESGLEPSDRVVYEGIQSLKEGMKINPQAVSLTEIVEQLTK